MFKTQKDKLIEKLKADKKYLEERVQSLTESNAHAKEILDNANSKLEEALKKYEELAAKERRLVFAQEKGLLPCESPACAECKHAVWYSDTDGRHIAGCSKGIQCADFEQKEPTPKPEIVRIDAPIPSTNPYQMSPMPYSPWATALVSNVLSGPLDQRMWGNPPRLY